MYYLSWNAYYVLPFAYILTSDRGKTNIVRVGYLTAVQLLMVGLVGDLLAFHAQNYSDGKQHFCRHSLKKEEPHN